MKKTGFIALVIAAFSICTEVSAQDTTKHGLGHDVKTGLKKTGKAVGKGAKAVGKGAKAAGKKTAEVASKGKSKIVDKTYDGKVGPNGETIYINDRSQYYWVDKTGHHHFVTESQLKDKPTP